MTKIFIDVPGG